MREFETISFFFFRCFSQIGYSFGGEHLLSLGDTCNKVATAIHELMHLIGFHHEQSRLDRDHYITYRQGNLVMRGERKL